MKCKFSRKVINWLSCKSRKFPTEMNFSFPVNSLLTTLLLPFNFVKSCRKSKMIFFMNTSSAHTLTLFPLMGICENCLHHKLFNAWHRPHVMIAKWNSICDCKFTLARNVFHVSHPFGFSFKYMNTYGY